MIKKYFNTLNKNKIKLPVFFPDATRAVLKTLDSVDLASTNTPGVLVNTLHLYLDVGEAVFKKFNGVRNFMNFSGGTISDSGGFQVMSLVKKNKVKNAVTDEGVIFKHNSNKTLLTPEKSIEFQILLQSDMVVVLDDFTHPRAKKSEAADTVERTILWAKRAKKRYEEICDKKHLKKNERPYILAVVQGGNFLDLRQECAQRLAEIGFDGFGYGGWPIKSTGEFNYDVAKVIAKYTPENYFLYGLGIGKPEEIVGCTKYGFNIFDCVLPTRDARHKRLYVYNAKSIDKINVGKNSFYKFYWPTKSIHKLDTKPVSTACDCLLCTKYSRAYLYHLFKIKETLALRLATIHNLRFYSHLMEKLPTTYFKTL